MSLRGIKLHLALLAMASSSGYLLFYLSSDAQRAAITQNLAHWSHYMVEAPARFFTPSAKESSPEHAQSAGAIEDAGTTEILLSGQKNTAPVITVVPRTSPTPPSKPSAAIGSSSRQAASDEATRLPTAEAASSANMPALNTRSETTKALQTSSLPRHTAFLPGAHRTPREPASFMDTSLLVSSGRGEPITNRSLSPASGSLFSGEGEDFDNLLQSETTAGRVSPGDSLGDEINLAARAYISNTDELDYQASVGFVVQNPDTELMIYALASRLNSPRLKTPRLPPALEIYDASGELVAISDPLQQEQDSDPAVVHVFSPGAYQVVVSAAQGSAGEVIIGIKDFYSVELE